jgi:DNA primase
MISIPYLTRLGGVVAMKFRQPYELGPDDSSPKYLAPVGQSTRIFNGLAFDQADRLGFIGITEGEFDSMILEHHCGIPSVGIPGVETWKAHPEWRELFRGYDRVFMFQDADEPGAVLASAIRNDVEQCHVISLAANGKDVNAAYQAAGADWIRKVAGIGK